MADMAFPAMSEVQGKDKGTLNWVISKKGRLIGREGRLGFMPGNKKGGFYWRVNLFYFILIFGKD